METFDDIFILDLHGGSKEAGHSPDGSKDENVFDQIQQGVAIGVFVKCGSKNKKPAVVRHAHLWGLRGTYKENVHGEQLTEGKYHWLWENDLSTTKWASLKPQSPFYLFIPQNTEMEAEYEQGWKISELMPHWGAGIITARDRFIIDYEDTPILKRLEMFRNPELDDQWISDNLHVKDNSMWSMSKARKSFRQHPLDENLFVDIHYRPFDRRRIYYHTNVVFNMRTQVMRHMLAGKNLGLITSRMTKGETFRHVQVTRNIVEVICMSPKTSNNGFLFPLYLYPDDAKPHLFSADESTYVQGSRRPNFLPKFIESLIAKLKLTFVQDGKGNLNKSVGPEDIFNYLFAILHSPTYSSRYAEFLKMDFPYLPLTSSLALFGKLCRLGEEIANLHLLEKHAPTLTKYPVAGNNIVEIVRYTAPGQGGAKGRVWINKTQYFEGISPDVWDFHIGGYRVSQKWIKERKGRQLTYDDLTHYQHIISALAETIRLRAEIDETIDAHGGWPIK